MYNYLFLEEVKLTARFMHKDIIHLQPLVESMLNTASLHGK